VTFDLEVTADLVAGGVTSTATYRLNYDYTK
jgi:hypothetical protein